MSESPSAVAATLAQVPVDAEAPAVENKEGAVATQLESLRRWNLGLAALHFVAAVIQFAISSGTSPAFVGFPNTDRGKPTWAPTLKFLYNNQVGIFSGIFLVLAGIDHLFVGTVGREQYESYLSKKQNPFRWLEYSISASFMHIQIGMLAGIMDVHLLFCIFGLTATTMLFGLLQEQINAHLWGKPEQKSMLAFWLGFIPHAFNWLVLLCFFFVGVSRGSPPGFVWAIIFILFFLDLSFAVNQYYQQMEKGKWADYLHGEYVFCVLSLVAKQLLAWLNFGGAKALR